MNCGTEPFKVIIDHPLDFEAFAKGQTIPATGAIPPKAHARSLSFKKRKNHFLFLLN